MRRREALKGIGGLIAAPWLSGGERKRSEEGSNATETDKANQQSTPVNRPNIVPSAAPYTAEEFRVTVDGRVIQPQILHPPKETLAKRPLLFLNFAADRATNLTVSPYCIGVDDFLRAGHRVLSFDLPAHGGRVDKYGEGITGFRNAWVAGEDRFAQFVEEARAVIDYCLREQWAEPGRVVVGGTSRAGYLALRLLAADSRVSAAAAFAPVTDWRYLTEFAKDRERKDIADLRLARYAEALTGKRVYIVIGNSDTRVDSLSCCRLFGELLDANARHKQDASTVAFHLTTDVGHGIADSWRHLGIEFLLQQA